MTFMKYRFHIIKIGSKNLGGLKLKKNVMIIFIVLIATILAGCTSDVYKESLFEGDKAMEEERYADAIVSYEKALAEDLKDKELKTKIEVATRKIEETKNKYSSDITSVMLNITEQAFIAENMINTYSSVWKAVFTNTLQKDSFAKSLGVEIYEVENYAELDYHGYVAFKGNFEDAIENVHKVYEGTHKNKALKNERDIISKKMKDLQNPPQEYKEAYNAIVEVYKLYEEYIAFTLSPNGSLVSYNQKANELSTDLSTEIKEFQIKIPESTTIN